MYIFGYLLIAIAKLISVIVNLLIILIILNAVFSWFTISQQYAFIRIIRRFVEPILAPIRRYLPRIEIDLSPLVAILILYFINEFLGKVLLRLGSSLL